MNHKHELRRLLIERRLGISIERRKEAREDLFHKLAPYLEQFSNILSFVSKEEEIDLCPLNEYLAQEQKLLLGKLTKSIIKPFQVINLNTDLEEIDRWKLKEPITSRCQSIPINKLDCILVPGLGFDKNRHRLGYGMGHFDRFLAKVSCPTYGIGFKEQFLLEPIPVESHDISLTDIFLF